MNILSGSVAHSRHIALLVQTVLLSVTFTMPTWGSIQHVVLVKFKAETGEQEDYDLLLQSKRMSRLIPGIEYFQGGRNNSPEALNQGFSHAFVFTFESFAALGAYAAHPEHQELLETARPLMDEFFVYDLELPEMPAPAEPGHTHHLVFVNYKEGSAEADLQEQRKAFLALEKSIPGVLSIRSGPDSTRGRRSPSFQDLFWVTFTSSQARDDYLPHPAHQQFVKGFVPHVEEVLVVDFTVYPSGDPLTVPMG